VERRAVVTEGADVEWNAWAASLDTRPPTAGAFHVRRTGAGDQRANKKMSRMTAMTSAAMAIARVLIAPPFWISVIAS
jgi:hypothetical protein